MVIDGPQAARALDAPAQGRRRQRVIEYRAHEDDARPA